MGQGIEGEEVAQESEEAQGEEISCWDIGIPDCDQCDLCDAGQWIPPQSITEAISMIEMLEEEPPGFCNYGMDFELGFKRACKLIKNNLQKITQTP